MQLVKLGGIEQASFGFLRNFTRLSQVTGVQTDDLFNTYTRTASDAIEMFDVSDRNQRSRLQGLFWAVVFKDIRSNISFLILVWNKQM